ncbi:hypothetical protein M758_2G181400 [Ceratodon purpureus]|uniref:Uncharacterized protein n=1 Tax=Ceratodon purpureus TaxID=3225 RepID=A0A8T0IYB2_CERPU|nr:hypothetical protein KC19_2G229200 [Ceratodon purpureus]KAG0627199.1 hypothetical protein M758_2G181400 [Ceratodon purpureus]
MAHFLELMETLLLFTYEKLYSIKPFTCCTFKVPSFKKI